MSITVRPVPWNDPVAAALRGAMLTELRARYADRLVPAPAPAPGLGPEPEPDGLVYTGVAFTEDGNPAGHCALRRLGTALELMRVYVDPAHRGRGVSTVLLAAAEEAARAAGAGRIVLETGDRQPEAVALYRGAGYTLSERRGRTARFEKVIG